MLEDSWFRGPPVKWRLLNLRKTLKFCSAEGFKNLTILANLTRVSWSLMIMPSKNHRSILDWHILSHTKVSTGAHSLLSQDYCSTLWVDWLIWTVDTQTRRGSVQTWFLKKLILDQEPITQELEPCALRSIVTLLWNVTRDHRVGISDSQSTQGRCGRRLQFAQHRGSTNLASTLLLFHFLCWWRSVVAYNTGLSESFSFFNQLSWHCCVCVC